MCKEIENLKHGFDVDGVLSDFAQGIIDRANKEGIGHLFPKTSHDVCTWNMCENPKDFLDLFLRIQHEEDFWLSLPVLPDAQKFFKQHTTFRPEMYVTKRPVRSNVTARWLNLNGFPPAPVITVDNAAKKLEIVKYSCDVYVDDLVETVKQMREAGVNALLYEAPYQRGCDVSGLPKIRSLFQLCDLDKIV